MDILLRDKWIGATYEAELDESIVRRSLAEPEAFAALYRANALAVYRYCYRRLQDHETAEDATSQTFTNAYAGLRRLGRKPFRPWLFSIAHNVVIDVYRARRTHLPLDGSVSSRADGPLPDEQVIDREERNAVALVLGQLPKRDREVVELRLAGLTGQEIAQALRCSPDAVRAAHYRAVQRMRELLEGDGMVEQ
jgi:RNA polymerase sigma-70 factor (ECF subfamily)